MQEEKLRQQIIETARRMNVLGINVNKSGNVSARIRINGIDGFLITPTGIAYEELLPEDKVNKLEDIISKSTGSVIFVGDGINDAPVLTRADVGIAMGGLGADAAIEAADAVIMDDNPEKVLDAIKISRKTLSIVKQNIVFALSVKAIFLLLGSVGRMSMWGAVFADVGVTLLAVLNSLRTMKYRY